MPRLCKFTRQSNKEAFFVNPARVGLVQANPAGDGTEIVFDDESIIIVTDAIVEVVRSIDGGLV